MLGNRSHRDRTPREGHGRTALVTGASSGIGRALSEVLAARSYDLVAVALPGEPLDSLPAALQARWDIDVHIIGMDLADPASPQRLTGEVAQRGLHIDLLANNAGIATDAGFLDKDWERHRAFLQLMSLTPVELTYRLLPAMIERGWGRILTVSSIAALMIATPHVALYGATKAMLERFSEAINIEVAGTGVSCTVSMPGLTNTNLLAASGLGDKVDSNRLMRAITMRPETVARQAYRALIPGQPAVVHGAVNRIATGVLERAPRGVRRKVAIAESAAIVPKSSSS